jgi:hypothetical protein
MTESYLRFFELTEAGFSKEVTDKDLWCCVASPAACVEGSGCTFHGTQVMERRPLASRGERAVT